MVNVLELQVSASNVDEIIEKKRNKGGKLWSKDSEKIKFVNLFYIPTLKFEIQYLKKGKLGKKSPHQIVNFLRVFEFGKPKEFQHVSYEEWYERLYPHYAESKTTSLNKGNFISLRGRSPKDTIVALSNNIGYQYNMLQEHRQVLEQSKHLKNSSYSVGKKKYSEIEKKYKKQKNRIENLQNKLISSGELISIQKYFGYELIYIPWYIARLDKPNSHRYIVIDHLGRVDDYFSNLITHDDHIYDSLLENAKQDSAEDFQGSYQDEDRQDYNQDKQHNRQSNEDRQDYNQDKQHNRQSNEGARKESTQNHYQILGIDRNVSKDEIKSRYRELVIKFHPDKESSSLAEEIFKKIQDAYETLYDEERRKRYDETLS